MGALRSIWIPAARPRTLPAAAAPVLMGVAVAARDGAVHLPAAATALLGALLIQVGTNFANDYFDFVKGTDTDARLGPARATQSGWVTPAAMRAAFIVTFGLAALVGIYLVVRGGWPVAVVGLLSILFGVLYTGGRHPLGYLGLGDVLVLVFFGPVATGVTYYVQALAWSPAALVAGLAPGLLATALLTVNNLRDLEQDRRAGKRTLAVRFGPAFAQAEYVGCLVGAALVPLLLQVAWGGPPGALAASGTCLLGLPAIRIVLRHKLGDTLPGALEGTGRLLVLYALAFSAGWAL